MRPIAMMLLVLSLVACGSKPIGHKGGSFDFEDGFTDSFSSRTGIYSRLNCKSDHPTINTRIRLTDAEISSILSLADDAGFYQLPKNVVGASEDGQGEAMMPCASYLLRIESGPLKNEVMWSCGYDGPKYSPKQIIPLVSRIREILRSKPELQGLPKSGCLFL
jgi:hypothetical protein